MNDINFFITAMDVCKHHLQDSELAKRVHNLLLFGNNYDLIGDSYSESIYYRNYVSLLCNTEPLEDFMENVYYKLVPHIYVPEPSVMGEVLQMVEAEGAYEYVPNLWSDMIMFDHVDRMNLLEKILKMISENILEKDDPLREKFAEIAWFIFKRIDGQNEEKTNVIK